MSTLFFFGLERHINFSEIEDSLTPKLIQNMKLTTPHNACIIKYAGFSVTSLPE